MSSLPTDPNGQQQPKPETTIGELRQKYGPHFAKTYGNQDTWGEVAGRAGVSTVEEYLEQGKHL